jgi:hypothetical protein
MIAVTLFLFYLTKLTIIVVAAFVGIALPRLKWVVIAAVAVALLENLVLNIVVWAIFGSSSAGSTPFRNPGIWALDLFASMAAYLVWAIAVFSLKQLVLRILAAVRKT